MRYGRFFSPCSCVDTLLRQQERILVLGTAFAQVFHSPSLGNKAPSRCPSSSCSLSCPAPLRLMAHPRSQRIDTRVPSSNSANSSTSTPT